MDNEDESITPTVRTDKFIILGTCLCYLNVELSAHGDCPAGQQGRLVEDLSKWKESSVPYVCALCKKEIFEKPHGICCI